MSHICMIHVTHMNEPCHIYEWAILHIWMSHVKYMNASWHTNFRACSVLQYVAVCCNVSRSTQTCECRCAAERVMSHVWISHIWMSQVKCMNESWYTNLRMKMGDSRASVGEQSQQSRLTYPIYEACVTYEYKTCVTYKSHMELTYPVYETCVTYGTHMKLTYPIYEKHASHTNPYIRI